MTTTAITNNGFPESDLFGAIERIIEWVSRIFASGDVPADIPPGVQALLELGVRLTGEQLVRARNRNELEEMLEVIVADVDLWNAYADLAKSITPQDTRRVQELQNSPSMRALAERDPPPPFEAVAAALVHSVEHLRCQHGDTLPGALEQAFVTVVGRVGTEMQKALACLFAMGHFADGGRGSSSWLNADVFKQRAHDAVGEALRVAASLPGANVPESLVPAAERENFDDLVRAEVAAHDAFVRLAAEVEQTGLPATVGGLPLPE